MMNNKFYKKEGRLKRFFSAESSHGSKNSYGFSNDTVVLAFDSQRARDAYVENSQNLSCVSIRARDATKHAANWNLSTNQSDEPKKFTEEFWGIKPLWPNNIPHCIGQLAVCCIDDIMYGDATRMY